MPNYRLRLEVGALLPGVDPADVLPAAAEAAGTCCFVEAKDVDVSGGAAWVQLRVMVDDSSRVSEDAAAWFAWEAMRSGVEELAATGRGCVLRRWPGGRWVPVPDAR